MDIQEYLLQLQDSNRPMSVRDLKILSDLGPEQAAQFRQHWRGIPADRRLEIIRELDELAEDNLDLDFRAVFTCCLDDDAAEVRAASVEGLWEDNRPATLRRLLDLLADPSGPVRAAAALGLSRFAYQAEMGELQADDARLLQRRLLDVAADPEQPLEVRRRAVESLGYFANSPEAQTEIGQAYAHPEQLMRESAVVAMGRSMRPTWHPYIERELSSRSPALRYEAARAVGELGEEGRPMVAALMALVDDDDIEVTLAAIWALGQVGGEHARRVLRRIARSNDSARRQAAEEALEEMALDEM